MKKGIGIALLSWLFALSGCSVTAKPVDSNDISIEAYEVSKDHVFYENLQVKTKGFGGTVSVLISRNKISEVKNNAAKTSLIKALSESQLYGEDGDFTLLMTLIRDDFDSDTNTREVEIKYDVVENKKGEMVFSRNIVSLGKAPMNIYFLGDTGDASYRSATSAFENNFIDFITFIIDTDINNHIDED